jgi:hypothetical protein
MVMALTGEQPSMHRTAAIGGAAAIGGRRADGGLRDGCGHNATGPTPGRDGKPIASWTGFYVGVNAGGIWPRSRESVSGVITSVLHTWGSAFVHHPHIRQVAG